MGQQPFRNRVVAKARSARLGLENLQRWRFLHLIYCGASRGNRKRNLGSIFGAGTLNISQSGFGNCCLAEELRRHLCREDNCSVLQRWVSHRLILAACELGASFVKQASLPVISEKKEAPPEGFDPARRWLG